MIFEVKFGSIIVICLDFYVSFFTDENDCLVLLTSSPFQM